MKILDRYLIKQFLQTILFGLITFTLIFVIIDLMENLDDIIDQNVPTTMILQYYLVFIPEMLRLTLPIAVLLACLFTVGKMSNLNELTAIKSSGVSLYRFMMPFVLTALLISLFAIYFGGYIVPIANKHKVYIEQTFLKKGIVHAGGNIYFQDTKYRIVTISYYDVMHDQANRVSIQDFSESDISKMVSRIDAFRMSYDTLKNVWELSNGVKRYFSGNEQRTEKFAKLELKNLNFTPKDVIKKGQKPEEMSLNELQSYAEDQLKTGNDPTRTLIEYHSRIAFGFTSLVVVLFGLPISAGKRRGGLALHFGINLAITFIYLVFMKVSQAFGKNGVLDPLLTAWFANIIFFTAAIFNIIRAQK